MERHPNADQLTDLDVRHMCPECGTHNPLCWVCLGIGTISTERLAVWQKQKNAERLEGR